MAVKMNESKTDIAYRLMLKRKKERNFYDIWKDVKAELAKSLTEEEMANIDEDISFFYTNLTLDERFVNVGENKWDLRERLSFDKIHIDMNEIYAEDEDDSVDSENGENYDEDGNDEVEDLEESYDDSTGSDADITQYRDEVNTEEDEDL